MTASPDVYPASALPPGFVYPERFLEIRRNSQQDGYYPWFFFRPDGDAGQLKLSLGLADSRKLIPFASLETGDGDTACFDGRDNSGDPAVIMMITDGSGRSYGFSNFDAWLAKAMSDSEIWQGQSPDR